MKTAVASLAWRCGLRRAAKVLRERVLHAPVLLILCYHRITDAPFTVSARCVGPALFAEQLAFFRAHFDVAPLAAVPALLARELPLRRDTVIFTFDDGYVDGYTDAAPLLERSGLRGTFFVSTAPSLDGERYWMDRVGAALDRAPAAARAVIDALRHMDGPGCARVVAALAPRDAPGAPAVMTVSELVALAARGHEIAAHGATHAVLSRADASACRQEIATSVERLRGAGLRVESFAYPFGGEEDIGDLAPKVAAGCGIRVGVTTEERTVAPDDDPLRLPRKVVSSQPVPLLAMRLERLAWRALLHRHRWVTPRRRVVPEGGTR